MPNPVWPADLPQAWPVRVPVEQQEVRESFDTDVGPGQLTRRSTAAARRHQLPPLTVSESQMAVFWTFYDDTLGGGVLQFDWDDPWPNAGTKTFRFAKGTVPQEVGGLTSPRNLPAEYLAGATANPQRLMQIQMTLDELPWWPTT